MAFFATELVDPSQLRPYPGNPRRGDLEAIKDSLRRHGQYRPIVANRRTGEVLAGNHVLLAACELGLEPLAVAFIDVDNEQARRIVAVDNRTSDLAGYEQESLAALLSSLPDLAGTGYAEADLSKLLDELAEPAEPSEPPPLPKRAETRPGELFALGEHRLLCGDARNGEDLRSVCDRPAELLLTDPPYGVDYEGRTSERLTISGDRAAGLGALLSAAFAAAHRALAPGAPFYVFHPAGPLGHTFTGALLAQGFELRQTLVWVKDQLVLGRSDYHYRHEPILYGFKPGPGRRGRGGRGWYGGNSEQSVIEVARPRASSEHPTAKPPELLERLIKNSSRRGALVLDPFAGSGSALLACERLERRAALVELDPRYCDVIRARWRALSRAPERRLSP
jgi:DNA modification methylase